MHCPTCRHDNPATTRFCCACGAVLVESAPDGRRRRVLRPWGLRRSAPPTISPDMPDLLGAQERIDRTRLDPTARFDLWVVVGLIVALAATAWFSGKLRSVQEPARDPAAHFVAGSSIYVSASAPTLVQEARLKTPPLVDVPPPPRPLGGATPRVSDAPSAPARSAARSAPPLPVVPPEPPRDSVAVDLGSESLPPAPAPARPPPVADRWQPLRSALANCAAVDGVFARATCEQEARVVHCRGFWGLVAVCPAVRTEYGQ